MFHCSGERPAGPLERIMEIINSYKKSAVLFIQDNQSAELQIRDLSLKTSEFFTLEIKVVSTGGLCHTKGLGNTISYLLFMRMINYFHRMSLS